MNPSDRRSFEVHYLLGKGGFGSVHLATMRAPGGFEKQVALKVLSDANPPPEVLQRFRDEARILAMVRDRAVVTTDPPVHLDGGWAVVMEYVDGASLKELVTRHQGLPATVALEMVQEVARVLDKLWNAPGPDGRALHLMHRDIKPGNLQITRAGEVKLLDFGLAKGDFDAREAHTTRHLSGTAGYVAPERFLAQDGERSDVFSLGVVLWRCLTGAMPEVSQVLDVRADADADPVLRFAADMLVEDPARRPSPVEVEARAQVLRRSLTGPGISEWARVHVPEGSGQAGPLDGRVLREDSVREAASGSVVAMAGSAALGGAVVGAGALGALGVGVGVLAVVALGGGAWWYTSAATVAPVRAPLKATVEELERVSSEAVGVTVAADGHSLAYVLADDVWWVADRAAGVPVNVSVGIDERCYEPRIAAAGDRVLFGCGQQVYVGDAAGMVRPLGDGIPGAWLEGDEQVSVLRLEGVTSTGDAAEADLVVVDAASGELRRELGVVRAEPRHGAGLVATKRRASSDTVLVAPDGSERVTHLDAYPVGITHGALVASANLRDTTSLLALDLGADGTPDGEPYPLVRLPGGYDTDAHFAPGSAWGVVSTVKSTRGFQRLQMATGAVEPLAVPSDVHDAWQVGDDLVFERVTDGLASSGVEWSVARLVDGRWEEDALFERGEVHASWLAGASGSVLWFLVERSSGFELVRVDAVRGRGRVIGSLPSTTLGVAVSPDGRRLAVTHDDLEVHVVSIERPSAWVGPALARGEATGWTPQGDVVLWDAASGEARTLSVTSGDQQLLPVAARDWAFMEDGGAWVVRGETLVEVTPQGAVAEGPTVATGTQIRAATGDHLVLKAERGRRRHHLVHVRR